MKLVTAEEAGARYLELRRAREGGGDGLCLGQSISSQLTPSVSEIRRPNFPLYVGGDSGGLELSQLTVHGCESVAVPVPVRVGNPVALRRPVEIDWIDRGLRAVRNGEFIGANYINGRLGAVANAKEELCQYMLETGVNARDAMSHFLTNSDPIWIIYGRHGA
ncbi:MAG: hypothetical protein ACRCWQ_02420 [Bacilli bacterium]